MAFTKPANLFGSTVLNNPAPASVSLAKGVISFTGLVAGIIFKNIVAYLKTAYSAGVAQVDTLALAAITAANSTVYQLVLRKRKAGAIDPQRVYTVISPATGTTTTTIAAQFRAIINADASRFVNATGATTNVILTEILTTESEGFIVTDAPALTTDTVNNAHVNSSGTVDEVLTYDNTAASATGFAKYEFDVLVPSGSAGNSGQSQYPSKVIVWANQSGATFGTFETDPQKLNAIVGGTATAATYIALV